MNRKTTYVDVILPLPVEGHFCYTLNNFDCVDIGQRVVVQFGVRKIYTAIVIRVHHEAPLDYIPKEVLEILDEDPIIHLKQLDFWKWISEY